MAEDYDTKRQTVISDLAAGMSVMSDHDIAVRVVSMLIGCEGNLNRWQETIEIVLAAHRMAVRPQEIDEAIAFVRKHSERPRMFAKGFEKDLIDRAKTIIETIDRRARA